jgi:hypothetical protein
MLALECAQGHDERIAREHADQLSAINVRHTAELDRQRAATREAHAQLEGFKVLVRERALRCKEDESWCDAGFNAAIRELGLAELVRRHRVRVVVEMTVEDTDDAGVAQSWAREALESNDPDVTIDDIETISTELISEDD